MMKPRKTKLPDGRHVVPSQDPLATFLAQQPPPERPRSLPVARSGDTDDRASPRQDYHTDAFDIRRLTGRELTICGAGSVGSHVIYALGPAGLTINVIDAGMVHHRHTHGGRTTYDPTQVGLRKVFALKEKIETNFPGTSINPLPYHTTEIPDSQIKLLFKRSLLVILAIDDPEQMLRLGDLAYPITELIQPALHTQGDSGHIVICFPLIAPCLRCSLNVNGATDIHRLDSEPASGLDIASVAQQAARIALDIAYSKVTGRPITRWDVTKNLIYISNTKDELNQDGPGLVFEESRRRPGCPVCAMIWPPERNE